MWRGIIFIYHIQRKKLTGYSICKPLCPILKKNKETEDIMNFPLIYGHLFSNKKKINTILAISSSCYFTRWKERSQDEISFSIFSEMTLFEKRVLKVSKFNFISHLWQRILKEL